jgi:hypothetical protein
MIEFKLKEFKNIEPSSLFLTPLYNTVKENFYTTSPDLWGSVFLSDKTDYSYLYDFNLVTDTEGNKTVSIYPIDEGLIQTDKYVTWYLIEVKDKNRKYKNLNTSEYLG